MPKYKWETYCYANIIKRAHFINERVLDRVLLAFDDLCCVSEFFIFTIRVDKYLTEAPYLLFFLCKIVAIILDETFDNFKNYIQQSEEDTDGQLLSKIISDIKPEFFQYCSIMRNNLHYQKQQSVYIGEPEELYQMLKNELSIVNILLERIRKELNIFPSKPRLAFYRFLRWAQRPCNLPEQSLNE